MPIVNIKFKAVISMDLYLWVLSKIIFYTLNPTQTNSPQTYTNNKKFKHLHIQS